LFARQSLPVQISGKLFSFIEVLSYDLDKQVSLCMLSGLPAIIANCTDKALFQKLLVLAQNALKLIDPISSLPNGFFPQLARAIKIKEPDKFGDDIDLFIKEYAVPTEYEVDLVAAKIEEYLNFAPSGV
jgi:hypothetical protein